MKYIIQAAKWIGSYMEKETCVVIKSTVPMGTHEKVTRMIQANQRAHVPFDVVSNPEFLREGSALQDSLHPDRIIIGSHQKQSIDLLI